MANSVYEALAKHIVSKAGQLSRSQREALKNLLCGFDIPQLQFPGYSVTVEYDQTVEQLVAGRYDWVHKNITGRNFPSSEKGATQMEVYLITFSRNISSEDVIRELDRQGLRPTTLKELLALNVAHPYLLLQKSIVALGSIWSDFDGIVRVPCLGSVESMRHLSLDYWGGGSWFPYWHFAAVRK